MHYYISPNSGWENFSQHEELIEYLNSILIPWVNEGNWHYLNFTPNSAIFEDPNGNTISIVFSDNRLIREIRVMLESGISSSMQKALDNIQKKYLLVKKEG